LIDFAGHTLGTENGLTIANGATLKGAGTITGSVVNAGSVAPGNSPGILNIDGNLETTGTLEFEIASLTSYDTIDLTGVFTAGGTIAVKLLDGYAPTKGASFSLMSFGDFADSGHVFDFTNAELAAGLTWDTSAFATTGSIGVVPEPSSLLLLVVGGALGFLGGIRRRISPAA
jgi:hypothetical protein